MNFYPLPEMERLDKHAIRRLVLEIFDQYGDGLNTERCLGGTEQIMNCVVLPLIESITKLRGTGD